MPPASLRQVVANCILSPTLPPARIQVDPTYTYVGPVQFILYGIAHVEQHLFVMADAAGLVQRLVWVQFEGFLPDNDKVYNYTGDTVMLGPFSFVHHAGVMDVEAAVQERPDSDGAMVYRVLRQHGYQRTGGHLAHRYAHLPDEARRNELMIIYSEPLAPLGFQVADFTPDATAHPTWPALYHASHARALASLTIAPLE